MDLVVLRHYVDGVEGDRRRTAQRTSGLDAPDLGSGIGVERDHVSRAVGGIDLAIEEADAAPECRVAQVAFDLDRMRPAPRTGSCIERVHLARGVDREQRTTADHWRRGEAAARIAALDACRPS